MVAQASTIESLVHSDWVTLRGLIMKHDIDKIRHFQPTPTVVDVGKNLFFCHFIVRADIKYDDDDGFGGDDVAFMQKSSSLKNKHSRAPRHEDSICRCFYSSQASCDHSD